MKNILTIDTGKEGGFAFNIGNAFHTFSFKDVHDIRDKIYGIKFDEVYLEFASSSSLMGPKSSFSFGENYGLWQGSLAMLHNNPTILKPQMWIKWLKGSLTDEEPPYPLRPMSMKQTDFYKIRKQYNKTLAQLRFPSVKVTLKNSDAILMWQFAQNL